MKVAVTGATGFVGRHVLAELATRDVEVVALARGASLQETDRLVVVPADLEAMENPMASMGQPDVMIHLAWGGLPNFRANSHLQDELPLQRAFLEACARTGLGRLVVAGTCLEYGMQEGCLDESMDALPSTAYSQAKDSLRRHLQQMAGAGGPGLTWARLFYVYGPGQAPNSLYPQLRSAIASGASSFPMSPGDQVRDFLPIAQAATQLVSLALDVPPAGIVNVCSGVPRSVRSQVEQWLHDWGQELRLDPGVYPYPDYEPHEFWGSIEKRESLLSDA